MDDHTITKPPPYQNGCSSNIFFFKSSLPLNGKCSICDIRVCPPNNSDNLCLLFCLYPSSMGNSMIDLALALLLFCWPVFAKFVDTMAFRSKLLHSFNELIFYYLVVPYKYICTYVYAKFPCRGKSAKLLWIFAHTHAHTQQQQRRLISSAESDPVTLHSHQMLTRSRGEKAQGQPNHKIFREGGGGRVRVLHSVCAKCPNSFIFFAK